MFWTWTNGKACYMTEDEFPDELILETDTPDPVTVVITRIAPECGIKDLGSPPRSKRIPNRRVKSQDSKGKRRKTSHLAFPPLPQRIYDSP
jgi:hypothetical protein